MKKFNIDVPKGMEAPRSMLAGKSMLGHLAEAADRATAHREGLGISVKYRPIGYPEMYEYPLEIDRLHEITTEKDWMGDLVFDPEKVKNIVRARIMKNLPETSLPQLERDLDGLVKSVERQTKKKIEEENRKRRSVAVDIFLNSK